MRPNHLHVTYTKPNAITLIPPAESIDVHCPLTRHGRPPGQAPKDRLLRPSTTCVRRANRMKSLLIVFHSQTGGTRQMADAAHLGASQDPSVRTHLVSAADAGAADVLAADGYIFATPENLAAMAGRMKDFFDRTYYPVLTRINGRPYASLICAGSDGENAARQIARIAAGWRLRAVASPLIVCTRAQTPEAILAPKTIGASDLDRCRDLGTMLAAGLAAGIF